MSGWEAANSPSFQNKNSTDFPYSQEDDVYLEEDNKNEENSNLNQSQISGIEDGSSNRSKRARRVETAEAAIARLTHSYTTAMKCVGAVHHLSAMIQKLHTNNKTKQNPPKKPIPDDDKDVPTKEATNTLEDLSSQLIRVAQAARFALQDTVLLDPLVTTYSPSFYHAFHSLQIQNQNEHPQETEQTNSAEENNHQLQMQEEYEDEEELLFLPQHSTTADTISSHNHPGIRLSSAAHHRLEDG